MKAKAKKAWKIVGIIVAALICVILICMLVTVIGDSANMKMASALEKVTQDKPLAAPTIDEETGYWTFTCDRQFKVLHLTDVHIGGGFLSLRKDQMAINAVYDMVKYAKPDLVIISGDMTFPVPYASGSFNNLAPAKLFAQTMESAGIYWAVAFGNHDTEAYAYYNREKISNFYQNSGFKYCLFQKGPEDVDGYGNYFINVKNSAGIVTQSLIMFDSHSYKTGFFQNYDNIHANQIEWYEKEITKIDNLNKAKGATETVKSLAFFHIPLTEYKDAYTEYTENGFNDTENVKYQYGIAGETGKIVYSGTEDDEVFETFMRLGSTKGVFTGHDHYNNFSLFYNGGEGDEYIRLTYGLSIDYLAYFGIAKKTAQRGGTIIEIETDGSFDCYAVRMVDKHEIRKVGDYDGEK